MKIFGLAMAVAFGMVLEAGAWDWFGMWPDDADTNRPPRVHMLLEPVNEYIELAEEASLDGDDEKAIENYRHALDEIARIRREHPKRAKKREFEPLKGKEAACHAAIDAIRFDEVARHQQPVVTCDTTELQKRYDRKHGLLAEEKEAAKKKAAEEAAKTNAVAKVEKEASEKSDVTTKKDAEKKDTKAKDDEKKDWKSRYQVALADVKRGEFAAADLQLEALLKEKPNHLNALLLRSAAQAGTGHFFAARGTLEKAMRAHPKSYLPYYNLAYLTLRMGEDKKSAREYYEVGRELGGKRDAKLEAKLGAE